MAVVAVLIGLTVLVALIAWSTWRNRRVDFLHRVSLGEHSDGDVAGLLDRVVPVLVREGYRMVANAGHTTVFEREASLIGPIIISIVLFPVGLISLLWRGRETITFVGAEAGIEVYGYCNKPMADYLIVVADDVAARRDYVR